MGAQIGNIRGGIICDVDLQVTPSELGDVLSIFLAQPADSTDSWKLQVAAGTDQALEIVGQVVTVAPGVAGEPPSRMVAVAHVPGAKRWRVSCSTSSVAAGARINISSSKGTGGIPPGVTAVKNGTQSPSGNKSRFDVTGIQVTAIAQATVGATLWQLEGTMSQAQAGGNPSTFVMLFDQLAAPAVGDIPIWTQHVGQAAGSPPDTSEYDYNPNGGYLVQRQLWVATSTTPDTYTPDGAHTVSVHASSASAGRPVPTSVLDWQAPVANAAKMPAGWTDAAGVVLLGMVDRLGASLPVVLLATSTRALGPDDQTAMGWAPGTVAGLADPVLRLEALFAVWCAALDAGKTPGELNGDPKTALAAVQANPALSLVYLRALAIAELPTDVVPTFSSVLIAARPAWRALSGRDVRIDGPNPPAGTLRGLLVALGVAGIAWYFLGRRHPDESRAGLVGSSLRPWLTGFRHDDAGPVCSGSAREARDAHLEQQRGVARRGPGD